MSDMLSEFHLIRPGCLLLIPIVCVVWWWWRRRSDSLRAWKDQIDPELLDALTVSSGKGASRRGFWLLIAWLVAVIAVAGPTWRREPNPFAESAPAMMILLKADGGMSKSIATTSYLERAKLKISDLANLRQGDSLGLIAYAGSAHLVLPPTRDTAVVAEMAMEISSDVMPVPGDRLDLAIEEAWQVLSDADSGGSLVVIANAVDGNQAAIVSAHRKASSVPIQFLLLSDEETPETASLRETAKTLGAGIQDWSVDNQDVTRIANRARRRSTAGAGGESTRWQEAGYWLTPLLAFAVALSFRREAEEASEAAA